MSLKEYVAALEALIAATPFVACHFPLLRRAASHSWTDQRGYRFYRWFPTRFQGIPHYPANNTRDQICL